MQQIDKEQVSKALADEEWDYVSVQQASHLSGVYDTYQPYLKELIAYVKTHTSPKQRLCFIRHGRILMILSMMVL